LISFLAGTVGSILGLGGGIIIIPALTLLLGLDMRYAIGASIISVIATSSGAAVAYLKERITNIRIGILLETATTTGAICGAYLAGICPKQWLYIILVMGYSSWSMFKRRHQELPGRVDPHPLTLRLKLNGHYYDQVLKREVPYSVSGVYGGLLFMYVAGLISGILGIGSGAFKVLAMDMCMRLPMKVSTATSNFMIGVTAAASAGIYFSRGDIHPLVAAPVALGVLAGAVLGTRLMVHLPSTTRKFFIPVLIYICVEMFLKGVGIR